MSSFWNPGIEYGDGPLRCCHPERRVEKFGNLGPIGAVIEVDADLERLIHEGLSEAELIAAARSRGPGILADGIAKMQAGLTTPQEVARAVHEDPDMPDLPDLPDLPDGAT